MPIFGYFGGKGVVGLVEAYTPWIAFGLLTLVRAKMIYEGVQGIEEDISDITNKMLLWYWPLPPVLMRWLLDLP